MENKEIKDIMENRENNLQATCPVLFPENERSELKDIERSLVKRYRKHIWSKFVKAIKEYNLIEDGDKIAVAISGGKDSLIMAKLFQELKKNGKDNFELEFIAMDPGYHPSIKELLLENAKYLEIPLTYYPADIFAVADKIAGDYPCYMCARMRRGSLYAKAKELGCNKLALGHHFNDVIETTMLNLLCAGSFKTMPPKLKAKNFEDMEIIRPLYLIEEEYIIRWMKSTGLMPLNCACMVAAKKIGNKRYQIKDLIENLKKDFKNVDSSIFRAAENVNINLLLGYEINGHKVDFNEKYENDNPFYE
ncbi:ATP-binding protein [Parvimonas micra]|uniref:tRNA 2-thiocytidine biosynthesis TtcA family protein n=1 Tax=Parvimonas micra TaxID=33033 RepID=UPI002B484D24|nr:ATP-binding protein [Parvimonas micra]MEB3029609.1 ATP-binding protein [Parvimonas micra]